MVALRVTQRSLVLPPLASLRSAVPSLAGEREQKRLAKTPGVVALLALTRLEKTRRSELAAPRMTSPAAVLVDHVTHKSTQHAAVSRSTRQYTSMHFPAPPSASQSPDVGC
jgi:hypothetical protein